MRYARATCLPIKLDRIRPRDHRAGVPESPQIGERRVEEQRAEAAAAKGGADAGRTEEAEAAIVCVVGGEAGDLAVLFDEEERRRIVDECARRFEAPDTAEL